MDSRFNEIQQKMLDATALATTMPAAQILTTQERTITDISTASRVGVWRLLCWIVSYVLWQHEKDVNDNLKKFRHQNIENMIGMVKNFRDGLPLVWIWDDQAREVGHFDYDLTGVDDAEARKVIDRCAIRQSNNGVLVIKIATDNNGDLQPLSPEVYARVYDYIDIKKVPGTMFDLINKEADQLKLTITAYINPQIIDKITGRLLNTDQEIKPLNDAINGYLSKLLFNGAFVTNFFISDLIAADGIELVDIDLLQSKYDDYDFSDLGAFRVAESGYYKIAPENLTINYVPYAVVYQ